MNEAEKQYWCDVKAEKALNKTKRTPKISRAEAEKALNKTKRAPKISRADGRTSREQLSLERRAKFSYDHDCDM